MQTMFSFLLRPIACCLTMFAMLVAFPVLAQSSPLVVAIEDFLNSQTQGFPGKVSFSIAPLSSQTRLAPCHVFEPFVPQGRQLWGKINLGVRCQGPSNWTIYVPVQLSVIGNYLETARNLAGGTVLAPGDVVVRHGDLCSLPFGILTDTSQAVGKTVKNTLSAAQPLRSDQLITPWAVQQGQSVRTVSSGPGFSVSSDGKALNNAAEGQVAQVRTNSGQVVSGIARRGGVVEVAY